MKPLEFIKRELRSYKKQEIILFFTLLIIVITVSLLCHDSKIALISAICGICYTIFAGYGKIYCYFIGMLGTFCYCYLAYKNAFWGNLCLYGLYYFPMEIIGIFQWRKHLKKEKYEIIKTKLKKKQRFIYLFCGIVFSFISYFVLLYANDKTPLIDSFVTVFSVIGQLLTVKRCVEQWYVWFFVNLFSVFMWIYAFLTGGKCCATVFMWIIYLFLSVYFLRKWNLEIQKDNRI